MSYLKVSITDSFSDVLQKKLREAGPRAAHALAVQVARDTEPFVPAMTKSLAKRTQVVGSQIIYPGPYARYLYNGKVMVDSVTGRGPMRIVAKDGTELIRFRKGAKLRPTGKPLKISQSVHPQAQDHWLEGSKAQNLDKWVEAAGEAVEREIK